MPTTLRAPAFGDLASCASSLLLSPAPGCLDRLGSQQVDPMLPLVPLGAQADEVKVERRHLAPVLVLGLEAALPVQGGLDEIGGGCAATSVKDESVERGSDALADDHASESNSPAQDLKAPPIIAIACSLNRDGGIGAMPGAQSI